MHTDRPSPLLLYASFAAVWLIWGSSFAASKLMVQDLPPLLASGTRFLTAGLLTALVAMARGAALPRQASEWRHALVMGLALLVFSNGINVISIRHVPSNQAALLNASTALWISLLGTLGRRGHRLTARSGCGLALGAVGVAFLMWPKAGVSLVNLGWQAAMLGACFSWALGTLYYRRIRTTTPALMFVALEMLCGGAVLAAAGAAHGDLGHWQPTAPSLAGLAFLTLGSSCIAYTAFGYLMRHTTPARLSTYAYVNPVIAAFVGWRLLGEALSAAQLFGTVVILVGVLLVSLPDGAAPAAPTPDEPTG